MRLASRRLLFLLSGLPLGAAWLTLLLTSYSLAAGLAVTPLVVPLLYLIGEVTRACTAVEVAITRGLLGVEVYVPPRETRSRAWWGWVLGPITGAGFWRAQAYLWIRATLGFGLAVVTMSLLAAGLASILAPIYASFVSGGLDYGVGRAHDPWEALPLVPFGCLVLAITFSLLKPMAELTGGIAQRLLGRGSQQASSRAIATPRRDTRGLQAHAWGSGMLLTLVVLVWAFGGAGSFWPIWVILPLALALEIHGWVVLLRSFPSLWQRRFVDFALAVHGGVWVALALFFVGVALSSGGAGLWPVWPIMGLGVLLAAHAGVVRFRSPGQGELKERIDALTASRAGSVNAEQAKLRSIERDLHDGAQARLVALGMSLGLAEQKLNAAEPAAARELLAEARLGAEDALRELRDLARGIHPPVLTDRGLAAAVRSLADLSPMQVVVSVDIPTRPDPAVESAAYFVVAEGLANAAKHARADRVDIRIQRRGASLDLEILDRGSGGADPDGGGLSGLRTRVEALDGTLRIVSPPGGPTVLSAELPCG